MTRRITASEAANILNNNNRSLGDFLIICPADGCDEVSMAAVLNFIATTPEAEPFTDADW